MTEPFVNDRAISIAALLETEAGRSKIFAERMESANAVSKTLGRQTEKQRQAMAAYHMRGRLLARKRARRPVKMDIAA